ncbi:hypothetical protein SPHV1_610051 [Novosphingobium sp. KN65.2]|nr:hypothetical protein SPHV1_610051 [Novosphingobium sp. KN65.2]
MAPGNRGGTPQRQRLGQARGDSMESGEDNFPSRDYHRFPPYASGTMPMRRAVVLLDSPIAFGAMQH